MNKCQSCKYWGGNREAILCGVENTFRSMNSHCENENIRSSINVREMNLPNWIKICIQKSFDTPYTFGCSYWEEYSDWKKLWE